MKICNTNIFQFFGMWYEYYLCMVKWEVRICICSQGARTQVFLLSAVRYGATELTGKVLSLHIWVNENGTRLNSSESGWSFCKIMCLCSDVHVSKNKQNFLLALSVYIYTSHSFPLSTTFYLINLSTFSPFPYSRSVGSATQLILSSRAKRCCLITGKTLSNCTCRILLYCACINHCLIIIHLAYFCLKAMTSVCVLKAMIYTMY